jgi:flavodoxin I
VKALVAYTSSTGNTRKVAEAIYSALTCDKEIKPIQEVKDIADYDITFLGFPTHQFGPDKKTIEFLTTHCTEDRKVALFVTHAAPSNTPELVDWMAKFKDAAKGADVVGFFECQGQLSKGVERMLKIWPNKQIRFFAKNHNSQGQPDQSALKRAQEFAIATQSSIK